MSLGSAHHAFIRGLIAEGRYNNASEIVRAGLRLLQEQESSLARLKPFTAEEARRAFGPDPEWDKVEAKLAGRARRRHL